MYKYYYLFLETFTLVVCLFCYRNFKLTRYKLFLPYLVIIVLYEFGNNHKLFTIRHSNLWIVNFELLIEYLFFSYFIISAYREKKKDRVFGWITLGLAFFTLVDIFLIQGWMRLCSIAIVIQYGVLIFMVCRYFYKLMQDLDRDTWLLGKPDFWVNTGLLFYFLAQFMFFASFNLAYVRPVFFSQISKVVSGISNLILYSCLIISFLCSNRTRTISSLS